MAEISEKDHIIDNYKTLKTLGGGSQGIVYQVRHLSKGGLFALKVSWAPLSRINDRLAFEREYRAIQPLNHPNIPKIIGEHFYHQSRGCIVMEFIDGVPLRQVIERLAVSETDRFEPGRLLRPDPGEQSAEPEPSAEDGNQDDSDDQVTPEARRILSSEDYIRWCCMIISDAAKALDYAHRQGVTHRDIKPENLMVNPANKVWLVDFGLARFLEDITLTSKGVIIGTTHYMSPEYIRDRADAGPAGARGRTGVQRRSDVYSLGVVLYELLALRRPFESKVPVNALLQIVTRPAPPVRKWNGSVSKSLAAVVHKAIAKDPEDRYPTAGQFAEDLQHVIEGEPVSARPYRYRFDNSEIAAGRPLRVLISSSLLFLLGGLLTLLIPVFITSPMFIGNHRNLKFIVSSSVLAIVVFYFALGMSLLTANVVSMIAAVVLCLSCIFVFAVLLFLGILINMIDPMNSVFILMIIFSNLFIIISLFSKENREWVRKAKPIREEHQVNRRAAG